MNINIIGQAMFVMRFEVTTAASGDVKRQTLMFFLGLWKGRIFVDAVCWGWALKTVPVWTASIVWFWWFSHPGVLLTFSCLAVACVFRLLLWRCSCAHAT